jgi:hypothetical protein
MTTGHGFVEFDCGKDMQEVIGFYPTVSPRKPVNADFDDLNSVDAVFSIAQLIASRNIGSSKKPIASSIALGKSKVKEVKTNRAFNIMHEAVLGKLMDDQDAKEWCFFNTEPCMVAQVNGTADQVGKAWKQFQLIKSSIAFEHNKLCPDAGLEVAPLERAQYRLVGGNCIDFMCHLMDSTGISDWEKNFKFISKPTLATNLLTLPWNYFRWTSFHKKN